MSGNCKMAASGDVTFAQDGHGSVKLHPYLITLMRWCVSCLWSTATVFLHRLMTSPLPPITASKPSPAKSPKARSPGTDHLHPEPRVECVVLHQPPEHRLDVIFVHGLYGSLGNTWRQGDWRNKYKIGPNRVPLRRQNSLPTPCSHKSKTNGIENVNEDDSNISNDNEITNENFSNQTDDFNYTVTDLHERNAFKTVEEEFYADIENIISEENAYISEKFYNNFLDKVEVVDNYETQAQFINDLFKRETLCDNNCDCIKDEQMRDEIETDIKRYRNDAMEVINRYVNEMEANINASKHTSNKMGVEINKYVNNEMKIVNLNLQAREMLNKISASNKTDNKSNGTEEDINKYVNEEVETVVNMNFSSEMKTNGDMNCESDKTGINLNKCGSKSMEDINRYADNGTESGNMSMYGNEDLNGNKHGLNDNACVCKASDDKCEMGCGCICDDCYSLCWPRDWIKVDYPDARVISINYTSDPHLWRPLWVKENKRLRLHERAEQMIQQLLELGVGDKPIIWVGHSKGGLFIKQIYCEAYEAYLELNKNNQKPEYSVKINKNEQTDEEKDKSDEKKCLNDKFNGNEDVAKFHAVVTKNRGDTHENSTERSNSLDNNGYVDIITQNNAVSKKTDNEKGDVNPETRNELSNKNDTTSENERETKSGEAYTGGIGKAVTDTGVAVDNNSTQYDDEEENETKYNEIDIKKIDCDEGILCGEETSEECVGETSSNREEDRNKDREGLERRASLWLKSAGFMFYSVPHRGSPLADIKTPITARSVELLEISKDCPLVLSLQERWLQATSSSRPAVRSLVETCRTLMSVLYLRIVSVDSADAGIGALCGVSVDHREICKPSSRRCLLYTELMNLMHAALSRCECL